MRTLRLMTQNQWNITENRPNWLEMGLDCSAECRMKGHIQVFKELMPDIVGGQEVNKEMQIFLKTYCLQEGLPYSILWGNFTPIIYRADKFELLHTEYIIYPKCIDGYAGEFNDVQSKSCNLGVFRAKDNGSVFVFATTHLWWMRDSDQKGSDLARKLQMQQAIALIDKYCAMYGMCPAILVGDMNAPLDSPALQFALTEGGFAHGHDVATDYRHEGVGYNDCGLGGSGPGKWRNEPFELAIDHILVKGTPENAVKRFDRYCPDYYLKLSDHAPVYIDIDL